MIDSELALQKLIEGNKQFVAATAGAEVAEIKTTLKRASIQEGQKPFAIILGCSDSRVPAELVFNCGLGDLFVIRVAGNIVAPSQIGSIEFACQQFNVQLVVVLGHSHCGAINATVQALTEDHDAISPNIASIVDRVTPAVLPVVNAHKDCGHAELIHRAMRANVEQSVNGLKLRSRQLRQLVRNNKLKIVGAEYSIETGEVEFYLND